MKKVISVKRLFLIFLLISCASIAKAQSVDRLKLLGQVEIPYNKSFQDTPIGGLSGLSYDSSTQTFYVISDDRSDLAPARFYSFKIKLNDQGKLEKDGIDWQAVHALKTKEGKNYAQGTIDPEGIAVGPDSLIYISSEGDPNKNVAPFINGFSRDGVYERSLSIPNAYWSANPRQRTTSGIRENLAFEGLSISPDGSTLYAATENALLQDGPKADSTHASPSRMIVYNFKTGQIEHQYEYKVSPIHYKPGSHGGFSVDGLSDVLAIDNDGHLLSFDRNFVVGQGNQIFLYLVSTKEATDINDVGSLRKYNKPVRPVSKTLVANMSDYGITIDNFEGLALGPQLKDGGRLLLMVSDNNFSSSQKTLFTAFSLRVR
ncbi:MAG TPA: esterase-like activity of phytase family protein [Balneolaceae bacterium]|nr:esterase-like activity of phytase family protein [Balneolaceae bacterium]